ncbi:MAG: nickel/cobalt transporter (NicO) family protein [Actinomycetota bacterium]|jgi:ABC-type nickel/cobalt efflux system permease component RcnA|nr:nickel/cobalt transporter (NicO) family protein [Actinomycetota bacterium]
MTRLRRLLVSIVVGIAAFLLLAGPASAHPLGNFTVNRFSGLELTTSAVTVHYVVDMAEIPTYQVLSRLQPSNNEIVDTQKLQDYADSVARRIVGGVQLSANGRAVALRPRAATVSLRPGQGGLKIMRIEVPLQGSLPSPDASLHYQDTNFSDRIGWKEIIAYGSGGQGISSASVSSKSVSDSLRAYPKSMLASPLDVTEATVKLQPGAASSGGAAPGGLTVGSPGAIGGSLANAFAKLIQHHLSPLFLLLALLLALGAGALHALGPGHGKSIMAAYLVGNEGKIRQAVIVGVAVSLMHTASVVALGLAILGASKLFAPEVVFPWLSLISALVVLALGSYLLRTRLASRARARAHALGHAGGDGAAHDHDHSHPHDHAHPHEHGHSHFAPSDGITPTSWKGLGVIALSGGLLPSPSALIVLLAAVALHRIAFGLVLVGIFSVGLAAALTIVGVLVIKARSFATRRWGENITNALPIFSAAAILLIGVFLTAGAVLKL